MWRQDGLRVETRIFKFLADEEGVLTSIIEEITALEMDATGDSLSGTGTFNIYSLTGELLQSGNGDFTAKRITLTGTMEFL